MLNSVHDGPPQEPSLLRPAQPDAADKILVLSIFQSQSLTLAYYDYKREYKQKHR